MSKVRAVVYVTIGLILANAATWLLCWIETIGRHEWWTRAATMSTLLTVAVVLCWLAVDAYFRRNDDVGLIRATAEEIRRRSAHRLCEAYVDLKIEDT